MVVGTVAVAVVVVVLDVQAAYDDESVEVYDVAIVP
jgi:hypothetical protein